MAADERGKRNEDMTDRAVELVKEYAIASRTIDQWKDIRQEIVDELVALVGEKGRVQCEHGTFVYAERSGRVDWHGIAQELFARDFSSPIPKEMIERHRGAPWREPRLHTEDEEQ